MSHSADQSAVDCAIIRDTLFEMGISLQSVCQSAGDYKTESVWIVTISRNGKSYQTEYRKGCDHRVWINSIHDAKYTIRKGARVTIPYGMWVTIWLDNLLRENTKAIPPTLDEVMYSLVSDANSVRSGQSFEDWCSEFGYDTDSRKAYKAFNSCRDEWSALVSLGLDFTKLESLFQNY